MSDDTLGDIDPDAPIPFTPVEPVPLVAGTFAIYDASDGGYVLVTQTDQETEPMRRHIPGKVVRLATGGMLGKQFSALFGG